MQIRLRQEIEANELRIRNQELAQAAARLAMENEARERDLRQQRHRTAEAELIVLARRRADVVDVSYNFV